ncbi:NUDIX hydrolase [Thermogemmatispora onikobensis]|uniref:NUDIX hydrolase n=1 Tax=Thermogemmatispora onikobensis TaxID=732234 RepID=UPI00159F2CBA|nr:NUDIX hydrolase [Thermogemmatispora onikobensis]
MRWHREETARGWDRYQHYRTLRAYSAGGVVFRLVPASAPLAQRQQQLQWQQQHYARQRSFQGKAVRNFRGLIGSEGMSIEVALVGRSHPGIWVLPKGTPHAGETIEQVALREVQEETGLQVRLIAYIGTISYRFVRDHIRYHKQVRHFLLEAIGGDITLHDQEYDRVGWFSLGEACRLLTYQNEVNILYQAEAILQRWLQQRHRQEGSC